MKNEDLDKNVITSETEKRSENEIWIIIGEKKKWKKICPNCKCDILFSNKRNYTTSLKNNCFCRSCSNSLKRWSLLNRKSVIKCNMCGVDTNNKKFCSNKCFSLFYKINKTKKRYKIGIDRKSKLVKHVKRCRYCDSRFYTNKKSNKKYCSMICFLKHKKEKNTLICKFCKRTYFNKTSRKRLYCSNACRFKSQEKNVISKKCVFCNKLFSKKCDSYMNRRKFCSESCANQYTLINIRETLPEKKVRLILENNNIKYQQSFPLENKIYDFFIKEKSLLIEVDGIYWHGKKVSRDGYTDIQKRNMKNDITKNLIAQKHGYSLLRIWEDEISEAVIIEKIERL